MEQFNYDEWKKNPKRKVVTRDGRVVEIIDYNPRLIAYPVKVKVENRILQVAPNGKYDAFKKSKNDLFFLYDIVYIPQPEATNGLRWRKCQAGYKFPSDAIVIPQDERTTDTDPRLVRCAVWDSIYILVSDLKKLPIEE